MSATLAFRILAATSVLVAACSPNTGSPNSSAPEGGTGGLAQAGSASHASAESAGDGAGGTRSDADPDAGVPAAGLADSGAGGSELATGSAGSGGTQPGSSIITAVSWKVLAESQAPNVYMNLPAAASRGSDAAVVYAERAEGATSTRVLLQRFDANGERLGPLVILTSNADDRSNVTLESDGKQYAACWNTALEVRCARLDEQNQVHSDALVIAGQYATIVASKSGWAIAYTGSDAHVRLQALTPELELNGSYIGPQMFVQFSSRDLGPLFAATASGYVLVGTNDEGGDVSLIRLSADLKSVVSAIPLGRKLWHGGQLLASDTRVAVSLSVAYGSYLLLLDQKKITAELAVAGGNKTGMDEALLPVDGGIGAAWLDRDARVRRRFFAQGRDSDIGLGPRSPTDSPLGLPEEGTDSYQQLLQVAGQTLLIARYYRYGAFSAAPIRVAALTFP
jgi:hypothetical protein